MDKVQEARTKSAELSRTSAQRHTLEQGSVREEADAFAAKQAEAAQKELDAVCDLNASLQAAVVTLETQVFESEALGEAVSTELKQATDGRRASVHAGKKLESLCESLGLGPGYVSVPARSHAEGTGHDIWRKRSIAHMTAVLEGRGESDNVDNIAVALERCGYLQRLPEARSFQQVAKGIVADAMDNLQAHWSARHAVHVWERLELSRSQMETLHHLLSFVYDPVLDKYIPIKVWENPNNPSDFVLTAKLASRCSREAEYRNIASTMNIEVGANGRCERDAIECVSLLYSNYAKSLRQVYSKERPAQPVLYLDGTGGSLGHGLCHGEMGCADFVAVGDSDAKQSRASLQPLFAYTGNDHAVPLRENLDRSIKSYNKLVAQASFTRTNAAGEEELIPAKAITSADMQGAKTTYGMRECSHSV